jgi:hypothetical protein
MLSASPLGPAFDVTPLGSGVKDWGSRVARAANGNFAIVWDGSSTGQEGISYQLFGADGTPQTDAMHVLGTTASDRQPTIGMDRNGELAIAWEHWANSSAVPLPEVDIYAARFDANGNAVSSSPLVVSATTDSEYSPAYEHSPSVALNDNQQLVVAYQHSFLFKRGVANRVFLWTEAYPGAPTSTFYFSGSSASPSVALNDSGMGVVAYAENFGDTGTHVVTQLFNATTGPTGTFPLTDALIYAGGPQSYAPSVAINSSGNFVVAFTREYSGGDLPRQVWIDVFTADGARVREVQVLHSGAPRDEFYQPSVALADSGTFVVVCTDDRYSLASAPLMFAPTNTYTNVAAGSLPRLPPKPPPHLPPLGPLESTNVVAQEFDSVGNAMTDVLDVSDPTSLQTAVQGSARVAMDGDGNFAVTYTSYLPGYTAEHLARLYSA